MCLARQYTLNPDYRLQLGQFVCNSYCLMQSIRDLGRNMNKERPSDVHLYWGPSLSYNSTHKTSILSRSFTPIFVSASKTMKLRSPLMCC